MATLLIEFPNEADAAECARLVEPIRDALRNKHDSATLIEKQGARFQLIIHVDAVDEATRTIRTALLQHGAPANTTITQSLDSPSSGSELTASPDNQDVEETLVELQSAHATADSEEIVDLEPGPQVVEADAADESVIDAQIPAEDSIIDADVAVQPADAGYEVVAHVVSPTRPPTPPALEARAPEAPGHDLVDVLPVDASEPPQPRVSWAIGVAFGLMCLLAGGLCLALGSEYTIQRIPASWFGWIAIGFGVLMVLFPRSRLVQRTLDSFKQIRD